jgi:hypothetical protein
MSISGRILEHAVYFHRILPAAPSCPPGLFGILATSKQYLSWRLKICPFLNINAQTAAVSLKNSFSAVMNVLNAQNVNQKIQENSCRPASSKLAEATASVKQCRLHRPLPVVAVQVAQAATVLPAANNFK